MDRDVGVKLLNDALDLIDLSVRISEVLWANLLKFRSKAGLLHLAVVNLYLSESSLLGHVEFVLHCTLNSFFFSSCNAPFATVLGVTKLSVCECDILLLRDLCGSPVLCLL